MMRSACAIFIFAAMVVAVSTVRAEEFPYHGYINADDVDARSGPGRNYYATEKLQRGESVEIWRHDPGGWYAIRPPKGSFSWVAAQHLKLVDDKIAEVTGDRVTAYLGSRLSDVQDVFQVQLDRGEFVEIVGEKRFTRPGADASETWYKIAPPSGEFRWVFEGYVTRDGTAGTPPADLQQLDLALSAMLAKPPLDWQLDDLRIRAERELEQADSEPARGRAERLLSEIKRCQRLQREYQDFARVDRDSGRPSQFGEDAAGQAVRTAGPNQVADKIDPSDYDGVGRLTPVKSRRYGAPRYALIDSDGGLLMFVSESPGLDMQRYIGQKVGVAGTRGFITALRKPHVTAMHVEPLESSVLVARKQADR